MSKDFLPRTQANPLSGLTFKRQDPFNISGSGKSAELLAESYSLKDAILSQADANVSARRDGLERKVSDNISKQIDHPSAGMFIPSEVLARGYATRADLTAGTANLGGSLI